MHRNVARFVALNLVLRGLRARVMKMAFEVHILGVHLYDRAADVPGFRVPGDLVTQLERFTGVMHG